MAETQDRRHLKSTKAQAFNLFYRGHGITFTLFKAHSTQSAVLHPLIDFNQIQETNLADPSLSMQG
jgi:hypothetical protein